MLRGKGVREGAWLRMTTACAWASGEGERGRSPTRLTFREGGEGSVGLRNEGVSVTGA